ncbi:MAG: hypothetical protein QXU82_03560 [Candidatus Aenigmatarchaeota archaeon]
MGKYAAAKRRREDNERIARERIAVLERMVGEEPCYAGRYRELIARIKRKYRIRDQR